MTSERVALKKMDVRKQYKHFGLDSSYAHARFCDICWSDIGVPRGRIFHVFEFFSTGGYSTLGTSSLVSFTGSVSVAIVVGEFCVEFYRKTDDRCIAVRKGSSDRVTCGPEG